MNPIQKSLALTLCAQAFVTIAVWCYLYVTRVGHMQKNQIHPQALAKPGKTEVLLAPVVNPSDNFENLFEVPVLFYVAVLFLFVSGLEDPTFVVMAWIFVIGRALHSLIHCTYNRVMHRFAFYAISTLSVWAMWFKIFIAVWFSPSAGV